MGRPGVPTARTPIRRSPPGLSNSASRPLTVDRIIRRPRARTSASTAVSKPRRSATVPFASSPIASAPSMRGAPSTTSSDRMKLSPWPRRRAGIAPARATSLKPCRVLTTDQTLSSAASSSRAGSASRTVNGPSAAPSPDTPSPSAQHTMTASFTSSSAPSGSRKSTCAIRCETIRETRPPCPRTPVHLLPGPNSGGGLGWGVSRASLSKVGSLVDDRAEAERALQREAVVERVAPRPDLRLLVDRDAADLGHQLLLRRPPARLLLCRVRLHARRVDLGIGVVAMREIGDSGRRADDAARVVELSQIGVGDREASGGIVHDRTHVLADIGVEGGVLDDLHVEDDADLAQLRLDDLHHRQHAGKIGVDDVDGEAVRITRLLEQRLRLFGIIGQQRHVIALPEIADRNDRVGGARDVLALELYDLIAVDPGGDRLAHAQIVERRLRHVEIEHRQFGRVEDVDDRALLLLHAIDPGLILLAVGQVDLARGEGEIAARIGQDVAVDDLLELRLAAEILRIGDQRHRFLRLVLAEHEGAGTNRLLGEILTHLLGGLLADHVAALLVDEQAEEDGHPVLQGDLDGVFVDRLGLVEILEVARERGTLGIAGAGEGIDHVIGGELALALMALDLLSPGVNAFLAVLRRLPALPPIALAV